MGRVHDNTIDVTHPRSWLLFSQSSEITSNPHRPQAQMEHMIFRERHGYDKVLD